MSAFELLARGPDRVGESPVWDTRLQALWWVDVEAGRLQRWTAATARHETWTLPERVGCMALTEDGRVIAAMESGVAALTPGPAGVLGLAWLARITHPAPGMRFNDGRCDPQGRLWVGTMVMDGSLASPQGGLYCLDERGLSGPLVTGMVTPNGSAFSPDGRTFYLSDSHPTVQHIWAFDFDGDTGTLSRRRSFVDMRPLPGRPDGAAVDSEGAYWICGNDAGLVHRISPEGVLLKSLAVPFPKPAMCCFGGPDLATLFVTSIVPADPATDTQGPSGAVVALRPGFAGREEPRFTRVPAA